MDFKKLSYRRETARHRLKRQNTMARTILRLKYGDWQLLCSFTQTVDFFRELLTSKHVLKPLLPTNTQHSYNLRNRSHNYSLISIRLINDRHFIVRLL